MSDKPDGSFRISDLVDMDNEHAARTLIRHAADVRASDLFFMTNEKSLQVSIRRLGSLEKVAVVPLEMGRHMIGFVKAMAGMDIAEHRRPLDGRWIDTFDGKQLDLRINTVPTLFGEDMTLRIWDREVGLFDLDELGMARHDYGRLINPKLTEGQVVGGVPQGIGQALGELVLYDANSGQLLTGSYMDYAMPRASDLPFFSVHNAATVCPNNPLGIKGCGEAGAIGSPPAVINAITDAIGNNNLAMPATPQAVWNAIQAAK